MDAYSEGLRPIGQNDDIEERVKLEKYAGKVGQKKISFEVTDQQFEELQRLAEQEYTTISDLGRLSIKLLTMLANLERKPRKPIIIRSEAKPEEQILIIL